MMPVIHLTTFIAAPADRVFDLARNIDLHKKSMAHTNEQAVAGTTFGPVNAGDTVTWKAKHLGKTRILRVKITDMKAPHSFTDEMLEGDFKSMRHEHHFKPVDNGTFMIDLFSFESPWGGLGKIVNQLYLTRYMRRLLEQRSVMVKEYAESDKWKFLLNK
ncbi:MAG TPA: SRPBCC family protein [Chitinophagaceae bacterium]|jgi:ligand-binding SRPBCC domain-containing protein